MPALNQLPIAIHADAANLADIVRLAALPLVKGVTTNPSLLSKAGVTNYEAFAREALAAANGKPVSLEVLADDLPEMLRQARDIAKWGANAVVKIPVTTSAGESTYSVTSELARDGVRVNLTAVTSLKQILPVLNGRYTEAPAIISVFAGRIADSGADPEVAMMDFSEALGLNERTKLLWASTREPYNIMQAWRSGCSIITVPPAILAKAIEKWGADMDAESLALVAMFAKDGRAAGLTIP